MTNRPPYYPLLRSQADSLFQVIAISAFDPAEFRWERQDDGCTLVHIPSAFYFSFGEQESGKVCIFEPGENSTNQYDDRLNWNEAFGYFREWLVNLEREVTSPDLWNTLIETNKLVDATSTNDEANTHFTLEEKSDVLSALFEIKEYLLTAHKLDPELVESRILFLEESANRLGRKDWINGLLSMIVSIIVTATIPPDSARDIFRFVSTTLKRILQGPYLLR